MAPKTAPTPAAETAPTQVNMFGYAFRTVPLPPATRGPVGAAKEPNKLMGALAALPIGQMILEAINVPDAITDEGERDKEFKAMARKLQNRIGGAIKRHRAANGNALHNFAQRVMNDPANDLVGVGIWRVADKTAEELDAEKAAAEAAKAAKVVPPAPPAPPVA